MDNQPPFGNALDGTEVSTVKDFYMMYILTVYSLAALTLVLDSETKPLSRTSTSTPSYKIPTTTRLALTANSTSTASQKSVEISSLICAARSLASLCRRMLFRPRCVRTSTTRFLLRLAEPLRAHRGLSS
jgi:hypothetical protein